MSSHEAEQRNITPHIIIAAVLVLIIVVVLVWPADEPEPPQPVAIEPPVTQPEVTPEAEVTAEVDTFEPVPMPQEVVIEPIENPEPQERLAQAEPDIIVDTSDAAITSALLEIANTPVVGRMLVNDSLLQRFVVTVTNMADEDVAPNHQLVVPPTQSFRVYQQAGREWIDAASYKRYTPYVDALESMDNEKLLALYNRYLPDIQSAFEEIAPPNQAFSEVFVEAIDVLLNTPEIPTPVEVYRDSVMYKYKDERIEELSLPQKQLLRLGPDNMRRVKAKLRDLKASLEDGSE